MLDSILQHSEPLAGGDAVAVRPGAAEAAAYSRLQKQPGEFLSAAQTRLALVLGMPVSGGWLAISRSYLAGDQPLIIGDGVQGRDFRIFEAMPEDQLPTL